MPMTLCKNQPSNHPLPDSIVGSAIGPILLADLAAEVINDPFIQVLDLDSKKKSRNQYSNFLH